MRKISTILLVSMAFSGASLVAQNTKPAPTPNQSPRAAYRTERPAAGKVLAVDSAAKTVLVGPFEGVGTISSNQVYTIATNTVIIKAGKRIQLSDVNVGDQVRVRSRKGEDGKQLAMLIFVGALPVRPTPPGVRPPAPTTPGK